MIQKLINKLFLVKEIRNQEGELHFLRYRLFACPWFRIYIHKILKADEDLHMHDHPWNFISVILKGSYYERYRVGPRYSITFNEARETGSIIHHHRSDIHQIEEIYFGEGDTWTLVFAYGKYQTWGYRLKNPLEGNRFTRWVDHVSYRKMKNSILFGEE